MQRIKSLVALVVALIWLPAVSCCLIDASGLLGQKDCCAQGHATSIPGSGDCDKPCGVLASANYFSQQSQPLLIIPVAVLLFDCEFALPAINSPASKGRMLPTTAPPELAGHWQFSFRAAPSPRAPSIVS